MLHWTFNRYLLIRSGDTSEYMIAMCSPRTTNCGTLRVHSANFLFIDFTVIAGTLISSRCRRRIHSSMLWPSSAPSGVLVDIDVVQKCGFFRFQTCTTFDSAIFQCLSYASTNPVTYPFIVVSFRNRICIWIANKRHSQKVNQLNKFSGVNITIEKSDFLTFTRFRSKRHSANHFNGPSFARAPSIACIKFLEWRTFLPAPLTIPGTWLRDERKENWKVISVRWVSWLKNVVVRAEYAYLDAVESV